MQKCTEEWKSDFSRLNLKTSNQKVIPKVYSVRLVTQSWKVSTAEHGWPPRKYEMEREYRTLKTNTITENSGRGISDLSCVRALRDLGATRNYSQNMSANLNRKISI